MAICYETQQDTKPQESEQSVKSSQNDYNSTGWLSPITGSASYLRNYRNSVSQVHLILINERSYGTRLNRLKTLYTDEKYSNIISMPRLLTLTIEYPPHAYGGIGTFVSEVCERMVGTPFEVTIVTLCPQDSQFKGVRFEGKTRVLRMPMYGFSTQDFISNFNLQNVKGLEAAALAALHYGPFDIIDLHGYPLGLAALSIKTVLGKKLVWHVHNILSGKDNDLGRYFLNVEGELARNSDFLICVSDFIADQVKALFGISDDKITVIPKAVDFSAFGRFERSKNQRGKTVLFVGRLSPEKGIPILLDATASLKEQYKDLRLLIVGAGDNKSYVNTLIERTRRLCLERNVLFLGPKQGDELIRLYKSADVVVVPSIAEAFGRVVIEAMAALTPVVVSDVGGLGPQVENGITGFKVPPGDANALARAVSRILDSPTLGQDMAQRALEQARSKYGWAKIVQKTIEVYSGVISGLPS